MDGSYLLRDEARRTPDRLLVWDTRTLSIGRAKENDIVLADNEISRKHAIFKKEGNRFVVGDYQTGNGTFVNGQRIAGTEPSPLQERRRDRRSPRCSSSSSTTATCIRPSAGIKLEYASHLKTVGMMPAGANPNATMLGMADALPADDDEDFVIERGSWDDTMRPPRARRILVAAGRRRTTARRPDARLRGRRRPRRRAAADGPARARPEPATRAEGRRRRRDAGRGRPDRAHAPPQGPARGGPDHRRRVRAQARADPRGDLKERMTPPVDQGLGVPIGASRT